MVPPLPSEYPDWRDDGRALLGFGRRRVEQEVSSDEADRCHRMGADLAWATAVDHPTEPETDGCGACAYRSAARRLQERRRAESAGEDHPPVGSSPTPGAGIPLPALVHEDCMKGQPCEDMMPLIRGTVAERAAAQAEREAEKASSGSVAVDTALEQERTPHERAALARDLLGRAKLSEEAIRAIRGEATVIGPEPPPTIDGEPVTRPGVKYDQEKPDWSLLPWRAAEEVVRVLMFGARKYSPDNWRRVPGLQARYRNAAQRHLVEDRKGLRFDPESGRRVLAHAVASLMFVLEDDLMTEEESK